MFTISVSAHRKIGTFWFTPIVENYKTERRFRKNSDKNTLKKTKKIQKILTAKNRNFCFRKEKNIKWKTIN